MKTRLLKYSFFAFCTLYLNEIGALSRNKTVFEINNGQIVNSDGKNLKNVLFQAYLPGVCIWVTTHGIVYNFYKCTKTDGIEQQGLNNKNQMQNFVWYRSEMNLKNAKISTKNLTAKNKTDHSINYQKQNRIDAIQTSSYEEIYFSNVYEGIDWKLYVENNQIKQEFIVKPFANINLIDLEYNTTGDVEIQDTKITISNSLGIFSEGELYCYQNNKNNNVKAKYIATKEFTTIDETKIYTYKVKIKTNKYDQSKTLVVDPILEWSTFYGATNDEDAHTIYNDGVNTWVAGHTLSFNFPTNNPGSPTYFQGSNAGGFGDAFILKFSNTGNLLWATYFGGSQNDEALSVFSNGTHVWVAGYTGSLDFPVLNPNGGAFFSGTNAGNIDGFILKFNTSGTLLWSTYCGGINGDNINTLHCNSNNELYVAGTSGSPNFPVLNAGTYFQNYDAGNDGFIMKFDVNNNLSWSTLLGGNGNDLINTLQTKGNNLFIGGYTNSTNFVTLNAGTYFQSTLSGNYDCFISKFSLTGTMGWSTYFGGNSSDKINSLVIDNNSVWMAGTSSSTNMPLFNPGGTSFNQTTNAGFSDGFISKFNLAGTLQWSTLYGGTGTDFFNGITSDGKNVFVGGHTNSSGLTTFNPGGGAYFQNSIAGFFDGILLKFDSACTMKWGSYFGDVSNDYINTIACNVNKIFASGYSQSNFLPTVNPGGGAYYQSINATGLDGFISVFKNCINPTLTPTVSPACIGNPINFTANMFAGASYQWFGPGGFNSSMQNPVVSNASASNNGNYSLIVNVPHGCSSATFVAITVNALPNVTISTNSVICSGDTIKLYTPANSSYSWTGVSGFTSTNQNPLIVNSSTLNTGNYYLSATDANGCANTASTSVLVNPFPTLIISSNGTVCVGANINFTNNTAQQYYWQGPNSFTSNIQNPVVTNANTGNQGYYKLTVTDVNNCKKTDSTFVLVSICSDINEKGIVSYLISLYPNPTNNFINLKGIEDNLKEYFIIVSTTEGKKVKEQKLSKQIDVSSLANGIYFLTILSENKILQTEKIIIN